MKFCMQSDIGAHFKQQLFTAYVIEAANRNLSHIFHNISYSNRNISPLQILSYVLEISVSIMKLQLPEFLMTGHPGKFYNMR